MFDFFKKKAPALPPLPPPPVVEVLPEPPAAPVLVRLLPPRTVMLAPMKWVTDGTRVGIVSSCDNSGYVVVDFVDDAGLTIACERRHPGNLQLCRREQIPAPRRPSVEQGILLGYL
jgi:hypothetical protein